MKQLLLSSPNAIVGEKDLFLCHTGIDKPWVESLATHIEAQPYRGRRLAVVFDKWDFAKGSNIVTDIEKHIDSSRYVGVVVSKAMLGAEWPTLERSIAVWSDPSGSRGRVIPIVRENVTLPASLRIRNWIDFRDDNCFEEALGELVGLLRDESTPRGRGTLSPSLPETRLPYDPAPVVLTSSLGPDRIKERIISNLYPVTELPQFVYGLETKIRSKSEIEKHEESKDVPPFILREGKLFTFSPIFSKSARTGSDGNPARLADWFNDTDHRRWAIELLNLAFKQHAWKNYIRFDARKGRFFFSAYRNRPKRIYWHISGRRAPREVTTPHFITTVSENGEKVRKQYGWRHQGFRANFILLPAGLFLRLEPTYLLTKPDGKTPRGGARVGPILSNWISQERNGQILRSLRFWSLVLSKGQSDIHIHTGQQPLRIDLVPDSGDLGFGIAADQTDYDRLMRSEMDDDVVVPQLGLFPEQNETSDEDSFETDPE